MKKCQPQDDSKVLSHLEAQMAMAPLTPVAAIFFLSFLVHPGWGAFLAIPPHATGFQIRQRSLAPAIVSAYAETNDDSTEIRPPAPASIADDLKTRLSIGDSTEMAVDCYISSRRSFGSGLAFLDLVVERGSEGGTAEVFQAMLRRELYSGEHFDGHKKACYLGARFRLRGEAGPTRNPGEAVLIVRSMRLLLMPRQAQFVDSILRLASAGEMPLGEVAGACLTSAEELSAEIDILLGGEDTGGTTKGRSFRALARSIVSNLPPLSPALMEFFEEKRRMMNQAPGQFRLPPPPKHWVVPPVEVSQMKSKENATVAVALSIAEAKDTLTSGSEVRMSISGWVQNRRRYDQNITAINLVDKLAPKSTEAVNELAVDFNRLECLLHPSLMSESDMYGNLMAIGSHVWFEGMLIQNAAENNIGHKSSLWVLQARLLRASWSPTVAQYALEMLHQQKLDVEEAAEALQMSFLEAIDMTQTDEVTQRQWKANEISNRLQTSESRMVNLPSEYLDVLNKYAAIADRWPVEQRPEGETTAEPDYDDPILRSSLPGSSWRRKKRPQLEWMAREIARVARSHPDYGNRTLEILDVGGGKGDLANYLARYLDDDVRVNVLDVSKGAIANGAMRARKLKVDVEFHLGDASRMLWYDRIDIVVALHACGHLSDVALGHAVRHHAGLVICPCCFLSNPHLRMPGTGEVVEDFLSISASDWTALKTIAEVQGDAELSGRAMRTICALRAQATESRMGDSCAIEVKSFPIQYSTRNICLVSRSLIR